MANQGVDGKIDVAAELDQENDAAADVATELEKTNIEVKENDVAVETQT